MKNYTRILLLCILFSPAILIASDPGQSGAVKINAIVPFYTEDFAGGLPNSWHATDSTSNVHNWRYTTQGAFNGNDSLSVTGTTASNGYMIYDSDSAVGHLGDDNASLSSQRIDCSTHPNVHLNFNEFLKYYNDISTVWVSNDGHTWTMVHNSSLGYSQNQSSPNPNNVDIDISSIAANQDSVYILFNYQANYSYYWMIDDVILHEVPSFEASLVSISAPVSTCNPLTNTEDVVVQIYNSGGADITDSLNITYVVDGGTPVTAPVTDTIHAGDTLSFICPVSADFSALGTHNVVAYLSLAGDTIAANDTAWSTLFNGSHLVNTTNTYTNGFEQSEDLSTWTVEDLNLDAFTWHFDGTFPHAGSHNAQITAATADDWFFTTCLDISSSLTYRLEYFYRKLSTSSQATLEVKAGQSPSSGNMNIPVVQPTNVSLVAYLQESRQFTVPTSGTYYLGFHVTGQDSVVQLAIDDILLTGESGVIVSDIEDANLNVYPNPSSGIFMIDSKINSSKGFKVEMLNSVGQLLFSEKTNTLLRYEINLRPQPSGIYFMRIESEEGVVTKKLSLNR